ncbi:MAG: hypothetical protein MJY97_06635 [Bacteroidales bacterium]|nr:hypothetical protein [Bacteroidales bacterium]
MKKLITTLMALAVLGSPLNAKTTNQNQADNKPIDLQITETKTTGNEERSLFLLIAAFNSSSSNVEINTFGCGNSTAYLYNGAGTLVSSTTISIEDGFGTLSVPETSGLYYIVINSDRCYSQGSFVK